MDGSDEFFVQYGSCDFFFWKHNYSFIGWAQQGKEVAHAPLIYC